MAPPVRMQGMLLAAAIVFLAAAPRIGATAPTQTFRFATVYGSGMVLQCAPKQARVWGLCHPGDTVTVTLDGGLPIAAEVGQYLNLSTFSAVLPATASSLVSTHTITATSKTTGASVALTGGPSLFVPFCLSLSRFPLMKEDRGACGALLHQRQGTVWYFATHQRQGGRVVLCYSNTTAKHRVILVVDLVSSLDLFSLAMVQ